MQLSLSRRRTVSHIEDYISSKHSPHGLQTTMTQTFWDEVESDYRILLTESDRMYEQFCQWIMTEIEEEQELLRKLELDFGKVIALRRHKQIRSAKLLKNQSLIYEDAFAQIVNYFFSIINSKLVWQDFRNLDAFDILDVKECSMITKGAVFILLCLFSAKESQQLCLFLKQFGLSIFELLIEGQRIEQTDPIKNKIHPSTAMNFAFLAGYSSLQFTKARKNLGISGTKLMNYKTFEELYTYIFTEKNTRKRHKNYFSHQVSFNLPSVINEYKTHCIKPAVLLAVEDEEHDQAAPTSGNSNKSNEDSKKDYDSPTAKDAASGISEDKNLIIYLSGRNNGRKILSIPTTDDFSSCTEEKVWQNSNISKAKLQTKDNSVECSTAKKLVVMNAWTETGTITPDNDSESTKTEDYVIVKRRFFDRSRRYVEGSRSETQNRHKILCSPCLVM